MTADLAQRIRAWANGEVDDPPQWRDVLREAADALDKAEAYEQQMRDDRDASTETYIKAKQRIKELEAELFEANQHRVDEAVLGDISRLAETEARLAAAGLVVEAARVCPPNMDRFKEKLTALRDAVAAYDSHLNGGLACPSPENPCMCRCHLDNECSDCQVGRHEPQNLNSAKGDGSK